MYQKSLSPRHISALELEKKWNWAFPIKQLILSALLFITLAFFGYLSTLAVLKVEMDSAVDDKLQIYWEKENSPFSEAQSTTTDTKKGRHIYWLLIQDVKKSSDFRIDPSTQQSRIKINEITLYSFQHFPVKLDLFGDSLHSHQIKGLNHPPPTQSIYEFETLGNDPQITIRPIQYKSPFIFFIFLVLITGFIFGKKYFAHGFFIISALLLFYFLLSFNETTLSFQADAEQPGQVRFFWRDKGEKVSKTRVSVIEISPDKKNYTSNFGNISNIEFVSLEATKDLSLFNISEAKITELGFKDIRFSGAESFIGKQGDSSQLFISVAIFLAICGLLLWGIFYFPKNKRITNHILFPRLIRVCFLLSSFLVFNLAWQADANLHPDENAHLESVKYFSLYSDFPKIGNSRALKAYQAPWAISRLDDIGISYFIAGKFRAFAQLLFNDDTFVTRAFSAFLFMMFFVLSSNKRLLLFLTPLLCTPQIWYLFSYANRGAVVLFISILLAWQLINKTSSLNLFLQTHKTLTHWRKVLYPGLLLGILTISQTNYVLFIMFVFSVLVWELIFIVNNKKIFIYKCLIFMSIGASIFLIRTGFDVSINGFNKAETRIAYAEQHAAPNFKPSIASTKESYSGLRLKDKGVSFSELFEPQWDWHKMSFKSFTGFYGYYAEYSPKWYYSYVFLIYVIVFFVIIRHALFSTNWQNKLFAALSLTAAFGGLLMTFLFCWTYDFQPQGRYMFPIIPIFLVFFWKMFPLWNRHEKAIILTSVIILTVLSFYSFYEVALNYLVA